MQIERYLQSAKDNIAFAKRLTECNVVLLPPHVLAEKLLLIDAAQIAFKRDDFDAALYLAKQADRSSNISDLFSTTNPRH